MKNLLTFGCSFTAPSGVDPNKSHHHEGSWPKELGNLLNYKVINKGRGGAGNYYIANQVYNTIDTSKYNSTNSIVMVMWSHPSRVDMVVGKNDEHGTADDLEDSFLHSTAHVDYYKIYLQRYHWQEDQYIKTLHHIIGVQEFLINHNIPYLFLTLADIFPYYYQARPAKHHLNSALGPTKTFETRNLKEWRSGIIRAERLEELIRWDNFHFTNSYFGGFDDWVQSQDEETKWTDDGHPTQKMHDLFAKYLYNLKEVRYLLS